MIDLFSLFRWTVFSPVGTKNTIISWLWSYDFSTVFAFVEKLATIGCHLLFFFKTAEWAFYCRRVLY